MFFLRGKRRRQRFDFADSRELVRYYSHDYFTAKRRFLEACDRHAFELRSLLVDAPSPSADTLTIDVAILGASQPKSAVLVSSGVHGVEGFFGSAVQLAFLEQLPPGWRPPQDAALVLIHALNPFGFAWRRRFNEENVDLNRNFLMPDQPYRGAPPLAEIFRNTLKPAPWRINLHNARVAKLALRYGTRSFWETLPVGQYDHPDWLFFGGSGPSQAARLVDQWLPTLLDKAREVVHLDFHTGLGRWANWNLLLSEQEPADGIRWWQEHFDSAHVKESKRSQRTYEIRGGFGSWLRNRFPQTSYRFATAEFGTYSPLRVIRALTDELHWHSRIGPAEPDHWSRHALAEAFAPADIRWRAKSLANGLSLIKRAVEALWYDGESPRGRLITP